MLNVYFDGVSDLEFDGKILIPQFAIAHFIHWAQTDTILCKMLSGSNRIPVFLSL